MREVLRALDETRVDRAAALRGDALAHDSLHRIDRCPRCGRLARRIALLPDAPGGDDPRAIAAWAEAQPASLPFADAGCGCAESAAATLVALSYARALPGRGELCSLDGCVTPEGWRWRWRVGAVDGVATERALEQLPALSTRTRWRDVLARGAEGAASLVALEEGLWAFAGPRDDTLEAQVKSLCASCGRGVLLPLKLLAWRPVVSADEAWTAWAAPWSEAVSSGALRAGAVVDLDALAHLLRLYAARAGVTLGDDDPRGVTLRRDELSRAVDLERLALSIALRGDGLAHGAARAVSQTLELLADASAAVSAARALRPAVRFTARGWSLTPERPDGTLGPPIALPESVGAWREGDALERAVRFGCDVLPPWSDPSRVCPCGAPACFVARLLPAASTASVAAAPVVLARWPEDSPRALLVAGVGCEQHTWFPGEETLAAQGISRDDVVARVRADAPLATWAFTSRVVDEEGARALVARGHHVASAMSDDHLVSALHRACGSPLRGNTAGALAVGTGALILHEPGWPAAALDRLCTAVSLTSDAAALGPDALLVSRDARIDALPRGRMLRLGGDP